MGSLGQVVRWVGLAFLLLLAPILATRFVLRDRDDFRAKWFILLCLLSVGFCFSLIFFHELDHWDSGVSEADWRIVMMVLWMIPLVFFLAKLARLLGGRFFSSYSNGFRISLGIIFVGVISVLCLLGIEEEGGEILDVDFVLLGIPIGLALFFGSGLFWNMVRRRQVVRRAANARLLILCYLSSAIILGVMARFFYEEEKYWVARNEMWMPDRDFPNKAWKVVVPRLRHEDQKILESLPPVREAR